MRLFKTYSMVMGELYNLKLKHDETRDRLEKEYDKRFNSFMAALKREGHNAYFFEYCTCSNLEEYRLHSRHL